MDQRYTFTDFVQLIERLRGEGGCPWDREQTHNSLKPCMTEETAELLAAIRIYEASGDGENMQEELGDILLQVVMHSVIAQEEGLFTIEDVIQGVSEKMVRRHPHVFGAVEADTSEQVLSNWEEIKKKEKAGKSWIRSPLREIPEELPALARACKVLKKADRLYGLGDGPETFWQRMEAALDGLKQAQGRKEASEREGLNTAEETEQRFADVLWLLSEFAYREKLAPEQVLADRIAENVELFEPETE